QAPFTGCRVARSGEFRRGRVAARAQDRLPSGCRVAPGVGGPPAPAVFVFSTLFRIFRTSFTTPDGIGFGNYVRYFNSPKFAKVVVNSLTVSLTTTAITVLLAYGFASAMRPTPLSMKNIFGAIALLPLFAPSLLQALGIVFLFGRNGVVNRTFGLG